MKLNCDLYDYIYSNMVLIPCIYQINQTLLVQSRTSLLSLAITLHSSAE